MLRGYTGEKLLAPFELIQLIQQETSARQQAEERARNAESQVEQLKAQLRSLGVAPETI
ncbi:hypothetical protein [Iningainema tapete]|uniref:hypothetical protein n=1 Tax=Iningainema tapete TaxID=2806730 RepID=UPI00307FF238